MNEPVLEEGPEGQSVRDVEGAGVEAPAPVRYDEELRDWISANLRDHRRRVIEPREGRHAAVALVLVDSDPHVGSETGELAGVGGGAAFLLCRRPQGLRRHGGQFALPGGRIDPGEGVVEAALRETMEEVGVRLGEEQVLGLLDDYATRSGFVMTPVVVWAGGAPELHPDPEEVFAAYRVGLHHLLREDSPRLSPGVDPGRPVVALPLGGSLLHAPTAAVVLQLGWLGLQGRRDAVAHFDSPGFAWS